MKFAGPGIALEYENAHPKTKALVEAVDSFCTESGFPEVVLTDVERVEDFYAQNNLKAKAFSWHFACPGEKSGTTVVCGVDMRTKHWTDKQRHDVQSFVQTKCNSAEWEVITRDHGTGPHFHVAYRDFGARRRWEQARMGKPTC